MRVAILLLSALVPANHANVIVFCITVFIIFSFIFFSKPAISLPGLVEALLFLPHVLRVDAGSGSISSSKVDTGHVVCFSKYYGNATTFGKDENIYE